jgi:hypothetical protein
MKILFYIFTISLLVSCKNLENNPIKKIVIKDTVSTLEIPSHKYGLILKSKPFKINGIECYWEKTDTLVDEGVSNLIKLIEKRTKRILINHQECCLKYGFDFGSPNNFLDVNFDGYKDFLIRSYGSIAMFENTNIYLFNNKTKQFVYSDLSDNLIETDSINRKLITRSFDRSSEGNFNKTKTHYFDAFGKAKYTEVFTIQDFDTIPVEYRTYEKIVNGKLVKTKKDTVTKKEE